MEAQVENGYRVVWDTGYFLDYDTYDEAHDMFCALEKLPAFQEEMLKPKIVPIRDGELLFDAIFPHWPSQ